MPTATTPQHRTGLLWRALPSLLPLAIGVSFAIQSMALHGPEALYPAILAVALTAISGYNLVIDFLKARVPTDPVAGVGAHGAPGEEAPEPEFEPDRLSAGRPVAIIALLLLALALITPVGFYTALPLLVAGSLFTAGVRTPLGLVAGSAGICAAAYLVFGVVLNVPLPSGIWW